MTAFVLNYLLNALWQAPLLFGAAWLVAFLMRRLNPQAEHRLWVATLLAQCLLPAVAIPGLAATLHALLSHGDEARSTVTVTLGAATPLATNGATWVWRLLRPLCFTCVAFSVARFAWQSFRLRALTQRAELVMLPPEAQAFAEGCRQRLQIGAVAILCETTARTPFTCGLRRPVLLLPCGFAERMPAPQLQAALAHEFAHVQRRDYGKQMLYRLLALPLCLHPAATLTLSRIAESREQVCDQIAAELTGNAQSYADSLLGLATLLAAARTAPTPAVGIFDAHRFERRIVMLHQPLPLASRTRRALTLAATGLIAAATCTSALALHQQVILPNPMLLPGASVDVAGYASSDSQRPKVAPGVMAGQVEHKVQPQYPAEAKQAKVQGAVVLKAVIGRNGAVEDLQVVSGPEMLRASAMEAVRQWVYKPYLLNGEPTAVETTITVTYSFGDAAPPPASAATGLPEGVLPPRLVRDVNAKYPEDAKKAKIAGEVLVAMRVGEDGLVQDASALSGPVELRAAAVNAVKQYVFQPGTLRGEPVAVSMRVSVNFQQF